MRCAGNIFVSTFSSCDRVGWEGGETEFHPEVAFCNFEVVLVILNWDEFCPKYAGSKNSVTVFYSF